MNNDHPSQTPSAHLPIALLALAIAILLASQIGAAGQSARIMRWQMSTIEKQIETLKNLDNQLVTEIATREASVKQSGELKNQLQSLLTDLIELSTTDEDAKRVIQKYNIQRTQPPAATTPAAAAPATP
jgi:cell shape-determining protein MreC